MSFSFKDGITPELARIARDMKNRRPILEAMGLQLASITQRAFSTPSLRALPWKPFKKPPKKWHQLLRFSSTMQKSVHVQSVSDDEAVVAVSPIYAAAQQFGYEPRKLPARPFFPFASPTSEMTPIAQEKIKKVALAKLREILHGS